MGKYANAQRGIAPSIEQRLWGVWVAVIEVKIPLEEGGDTRVVEAPLYHRLSEYSFQRSCRSW
jgi:hypothetical protein